MKDEENIVEKSALIPYEKEYSEPGLWEKVKGAAKTAGAETLYKVMQLYYAAQNPACPPKVKATIYGALGYFLMPFDLIPDMTLGLGFTDDTVAIGYALVIASMYIDDDVKQQAKEKLTSIFGAKFVENIKDETKTS